MRSTANPDHEHPPWYQDGLRFSCTRCGACCTGAPGYVWVDPEQIASLAEYRGEPIEAFSRAFVRQVGRNFSLIEHPNGDCVFWDRATGCTVYPARPNQCRTWPFWPETVETPEDWERTRQVCPGAGQGRLYSLEAIRSAVDSTPQ